MRLALIIVPSWSTATPPLGLATIAGAAKAAGHEVAQFDINAELWQNFRNTNNDLWNSEKSNYWLREFEFNTLVYPTFSAQLIKCLDRVLEWNPEVVGFSVYDSSLLCSREATKYLKSKNKNIKLIYGGPDATRRKLETRFEFDRSSLDAAVVGEGDATIVELLARWQNGTDLVGCKGIAHRGPAGEVIFEEERPNIKLSEIPKPVYENINFDLYANRSLPVMMSRGCTAKCTFCGETRYWKNFRSAEAIHVFEEFKNNKEKYRISSFLMSDSLINGNFQVLSDLANLIIDSGEKFIWGGYARLDKRMTPELLKRLSQAGMAHLNFGLETGSQKVMDLMEKRTTVEVASEIIKNAHLLGIDVVVNIVVGFPGETDEDFEKTISFLEEHIECISSVSTGDTLAVLYGTPLETNPQKFGIKTDENGAVWRDENYNWISADGLNTDLVRRSRLLRLRKFLNQFSHIKWSPGGDTAKPRQMFFEINSATSQSTTFERKVELSDVKPEFIHWKYGSKMYGSRATTRSDDFKYWFSPVVSHAPYTFREEIFRACEKIGSKRAGRPIGLCYSGGVGSKIIGVALKKLGIPFDLFYLDLWGLKTEDMEQAIISARMNFQKELNIVSIKRRDFYLNIALREFAQYGIEFPASLAMTALFNKIPKTHFIVNGHGSLERVFSTFRKIGNKYSVSKWEAGRYLPFSSSFIFNYLWAVNNQRVGEFYFFSSTPELIASVLQHKLFQLNYPLATVREILFSEFPELDRTEKNTLFGDSALQEGLRIRSWLKCWAKDADQEYLWYPDQGWKVDLDSLFKNGTTRAQGSNRLRPGISTY